MSEFDASDPSTWEGNVAPDDGPAPVILDLRTASNRDFEATDHVHTPRGACVKNRHNVHCDSFLDISEKPMSYGTDTASIPKEARIAWSKLSDDELAEVYRQTSRKVEWMLGYTAALTDLGRFDMVAT